tara:strand:- start:469 stop:1806 length:1338 start_codon:yes stop_codon:yes gene_type:complete
MGGLGGHMSHIHEDLDLTYQEILNMLGMIARTELEVTEKVDGYNLFISYTVNEDGDILMDGDVRAYRNKSDVKKGGMSPDEYASKWKGHPAEQGFMKGFTVVSRALKTLSGEELREIFENGDRYLNMEIMYYDPATGKDSNIIHYGASYIVMHGLMEGDDMDSEAIEAFNKLVSALHLAEVELDNQMWSVNGPTVITLNNIEGGEAHQKLIDDITEFSQKSGGLSSRVHDYAKMQYNKICASNGLSGVNCSGLSDIVFQFFDDAILDIKVAKEKRRVAYNSFKKTLSSEDKKIASKLGTEQNSIKIILGILRPLEKIISDFAIEVLRDIKSAFAVDHDATVKKLKSDLSDAIKKIKRIDKENSFDLVRQLEKLGDPELAVTSSLEGIVFKAPNGRVYKLTGSFAMLNQIIGRAMRMREPEPDSDQDTITESKIKSLIRHVLSNRF